MTDLWKEGVSSATCISKIILLKSKLSRHCYSLDFSVFHGYKIMGCDNEEPKQGFPLLDYGKFDFCLWLTSCATSPSVNEKPSYCSEFEMVIKSLIYVKSTTSCPNFKYWFWLNSESSLPFHKITEDSQQLQHLQPFLLFLIKWHCIDVVVYVFIIYSSKNPEEAELEDILNSVVSPDSLQSIYNSSYNLNKNNRILIPWFTYHCSD